jgi:phosphatidylglycerophosphate synthase
MPHPDNLYSFDSLFTYKFVDLISNKNMEPNVITAINIFPSILSLYFLYKTNYLFFYIFLIVRLVLDCLDGHVARKYNKESDFGDKFDHYLDLIFYVGLIVILFSSMNLVFVLLIIIVLIIILERYYIPILSEIFNIIEDNTVLLVPIISGLIIYFRNFYNIKKL